MPTEALGKALAQVSAKSHAAVKRKMAGVPRLGKSELLKIRDQDAKASRVYANLLALCTLLWRPEVPAHKSVSRFEDKEKFTDVTRHELAPCQDTDAAYNEVWRQESMKDEEMLRLNAFVLAVWTFTVTSLAAFRGKKGLDPKISTDQQEAEDEDPGLPSRLQR